jgi:hypothetical protein
MALGTPVISTVYSVKLDFMTSENSLLVDYDFVSVNDPTGTYTVDSKWADPKIESAARHMTMIFSDTATAQRIGELGQESISAIASDASDVKFVQERVNSIYSSLIGHPSDKQPSEKSAWLDAQYGLVSVFAFRIRKWISRNLFRNQREM